MKLKKSKTLFNKKDSIIKKEKEKKLEVVSCNK